MHKVPNPYASDGRDLLFFSDPPHLMKTTRNCWNSKARSLWVCALYLYIYVDVHAYRQIKVIYNDYRIMECVYHGVISEHFMKETV